jgi:hypothetical protein
LHASHNIEHWFWKNMYCIVQEQRREERGVDYGMIA